MEKLIIFTFCLNLFLFVIYEKLAKLINIYDYPSKEKFILNQLQLWVVS